MKITDETLSAFLDAELPEADMQAIRARLQRDPTLSDRLAQLAAVDHQLARHYSAIDQEPMPAAVTDMLAKAASGPAPATDSDHVVAFPGWRRWAQGVRRHAGMAVAAMLVMALGVVQWFNDTPDAQWLEVARALETTPSGASHELADGRTLAPRLTFRNHQGDYCRQFQLQGTGQATENIACRTGERWTLTAEKDVPPSPETAGYRTASGGSVLDETLDRMMDGAVVAPDRERELIADQWSTPE